MGLLTTSQAFTIERPTHVYDPLGTTTTWDDAGKVNGWIDLLTGTDLPTGGSDNAFVEESTHVLITDGMPDVIPTDADVIRRDSTGRAFHVTYVDDVTGVGHHLEIYMRRAGEEVPR